MTAAGDAGADTTLLVRLDERWIDLPVREDGDPGDWATGVVAEALRFRALREPPAVVELYVQSYALLVERLRARRDGDGASAAEYLAAAYALVSQDDLLPVVAAELWAAGTPLDVERIVDGLVVARGQRFGEPVVTELESPAGRAVRLKQYIVVPDATGQDVVETSVAYIWPGPLEGTSVLLTAWFGSVIDGELYEPVLDELAGSLSFGTA